MVAALMSTWVSVWVPETRPLGLTWGVGVPFWWA